MRTCVFQCYNSLVGAPPTALRATRSLMAGFET